MRIAYVVFDGITWLDLIGLYDPISRLATHHIPKLKWDFCSLTDTVQDNHGFTMQVPKKIPSLASYDVLVVPGGVGTRTLIHDQPFLSWLQTGSGATQKVSICTGSLLLGAAGFLKGKVATTHFNEYETLRPYCREVRQTERIVEDGTVITAGAVAASIDLGLYLCQRWAGAEAASDIRRRMNYQGQSTFRA